MKNKIIALAVCLALSLTGCAATSETENNIATTSSSASQSSSTSDESGVSTSEIEIESSTETENKNCEEEHYAEGTLAGEEVTDVTDTSLQSDSTVYEIESDDTTEYEIYESIGCVTAKDETATIYSEMDTVSDIEGYIYSPWYISVINVEDEWLYVQNEEAEITGYVQISEVEYALYDEDGNAVEVETSADTVETSEETTQESLSSASLEDEDEIIVLETYVTTSEYELTTDAETILERIKDAAEEDELWEACEQNYINTTSSSKIQEFLNYYYQSYALVKPNTDISYFQTGSTFKITNIYETESERESTVEYIISKIGVEEVDDPYQAVIDACSRIRSALTFNYNYTTATTKSAFSAGQGVCIHYSRAAAIILNAEGIPCRIVGGTYNNGKSFHSWNEVYIDGEWITIDFCEFTDQASRNPDGFVTDSYASLYKYAYFIN